MDTMNGTVKVIPLNKECPHPDLEQEKNGLWTFKKLHAPDPATGESIAKIVKFHAMTRNCPYHGEVSVQTRNFQPERMQSTEGLSCGCTLLIGRLVKGLKKPYTDATEAKNWVHRGWSLKFLNTIIGS